jgi:hypothetical protein
MSRIFSSKKLPVRNATMPEVYTFIGVVLPERAQLSLQFITKVTHLLSKNPADVKVSIINNHLIAIVQCDQQWDIFDLRNLAQAVVNNHLAMVGYLLGFAYDLEITRVINPRLDIDQVFGIDIPILSNRTAPDELTSKLHELMKSCTGENGVYMLRCLGDLQQAIKNADDTAFYCYRALESLRHHNSRTKGISSDDKAAQWRSFREAAKCTEAVLRSIKIAADPLRHGQVQVVTGTERAKLFTDTWTIIDAYLEQINNRQ